MEKGKPFLLNISTFNYLRGYLVENLIQTLIIRCHIVFHVWFIERAWVACGDMGSVRIPEENGTTFSDQTGPDLRNGCYHFLFLFRIPSVYKSTQEGRVCHKWNGKFRSDQSDRNKWTTSRGDPEYSGQKKPKRTFPFELRIKFVPCNLLVQSTMF